MISSISAGILAFLLTLIGIPAFIRFYRKAQITGQQMHEDVKQHQAKAGTPTMGRSCLPYRCSSCELSYCSLYPTIDQQCRHDFVYLGVVWFGRFSG